MKILIVAATEPEIAPLKKAVAVNSYLKGKTDFLVTGVGMTATAYHLTKKLHENKFNLAVNLGLAGSFKKQIPLVEVVNVVSDRFADLGAKTREGFLTLAEMGLEKRNQFPSSNGRLINDFAKKHSGLKRLKKVNAVTVNTVYDNGKDVKAMINKFNPDIESMEGAAFFYVCMMEKIPCIQVRAVSNMAGIRDKSQWNIPFALSSLTEAAIDFLKTELSKK